MTKVTKEQHEALHVLGKALNDAKKTAFRYDHTRPNAEITAEIDEENTAWGLPYDHTNPNAEINAEIDAAIEKAIVKRELKQD
tara:strand:- start:1361 stop:1609 length:249 start_codon:yes stop_codon:yes gene_type:complete